MYRTVVGTLEHTVNAFLCCYCPHDVNYIIIITLSSDISHGRENFECEHSSVLTEALILLTPLSGVRTFLLGVGWR